MSRQQRNLRRRRAPIASLNVVPYIDVMLVLLLVFMITTPLLQNGVTIQLPKTQAKAIKQPKSLPIIVSINPQGQLFLNISEHPKQPLAQRELMLRLVAEQRLNHHPLTVLVRGDQATPYQHIMRAMSALQRVGITDISLLAQALPDQ